MRKRKKQTRAYSLGGILLVVLLLAIILLLVFGGVAVNLDGCEGTFPSTVSVARASPFKPPMDMVNPPTDPSTDTSTETPSDTPTKPSTSSSVQGTYSGVLEDLGKDQSFKALDYPVKENDYTLAIVQIAESSDKELLVYVYQPAGEKVQATELRFSTAINDNFKASDYTLELLSSSDTLFKYRVKDFTVKTDAVRYYDVVCIFRKYIDGVDNKPTGGQSISSVSFDVGKRWTACTVDGKVSYGCSEIDTIVITNKRVGRINYPDGFYLLLHKSCASHYVAFSTDKPMDKLMEVDMTYISTSYKGKGAAVGSLVLFTDVTYGEPETVSLTLKGEQKGGNNGGLFAHKYEWDRIQTAETFLSDEDLNLTDEARADLKGMQWVLRFAETEYSTVLVKDKNGLPLYTSQEGTDVTDVTILRLMFETDGDVYNLGVVDNNQSSGSKSDGTPNSPDSSAPWWERMTSFFRSIGSWFGGLWQNSTARTVIIVIICVLFGIVLISFFAWLIKKLK